VEAGKVEVTTVQVSMYLWDQRDCQADTSESELVALGVEKPFRIGHTRGLALRNFTGRI
jgi:hypothetical protein